MSALNPAAVEHAERCPGDPHTTQGGDGTWFAVCSHQDWTAVGCESRAEAGAVFYGHNPREETS